MSDDERLVLSRSERSPPRRDHYRRDRSPPSASARSYNDERESDAEYRRKRRKLNEEDEHQDRRLPPRRSPSPHSDRYRNDRFPPRSYTRDNYQSDRPRDSYDQRRRVRVFDFQSSLSSLTTFYYRMTTLLTVEDRLIQMIPSFHPCFQSIKAK